MNWRGNQDREQKDGWGQFEDGGREIHFESFSDFHYLCRLFDIRKSADHLAGKKEALDALRRYVEGYK